MNPLPESDLAKPFDVFLCYNSKDKQTIRAIALQLKQRDISYWLDEEQLPPGCHWRKIQERDMSRIQTVAVLIGKNGVGNWQDMEISIFLQMHREYKLPIIPVFLDDAPEKSNLPEFLKPFSWIDFRCADADPIKQLVKSITQAQSNTDSVSIPLTEDIIEAAIQANIPNNLTQQGAIAFVGRDTELDRLHDLLQQEAPVAIGAIAGMGGVGKTELALQYAYQQRDCQTYPGSICWLQARQDLKIQVVLFAQTHLGLHPPTDLDLDAQLQWCWQHWGKGKTLLILDDVQALSDVEALAIPGRSQFKVLMTTRSHFGSLVRELNLEVLSKKDALKLLRSLVTNGRIDRQLVETKAICKWLGYLPLGLELVGRYLARKPDVSVTTLQQRLQAQHLEAKALKDREPGMTASLGVAAAFELSWQELPLEAQRLAAFLSLFALAEIPWHLAQASFPEQEEEELEDLRDEKLVDLNLLKRTKVGHYQLHQLLREFFAAKRQQMVEEEKRKQSFCQVMVTVAKQIPPTPTLKLIEQVNSAIPHLKEAATALHPALSDVDLITPATRIARFYEGQSAYAEAEFWKEHCLAIATARLGQDHPDTATSLDNLALLYRSQGRYGEAEPLCLQALEIRRSQLGRDHPDTATSLDNLALLYQSQGRYSEAEPLCVQALGIWRSQLGQDHPDTATSLNNLALLYQSQGRYSEAEPLYLQALEIRRSQLGQDHPDTATSLDNLAGLYYSQSRYGEVELLCLQALEIRRSQLGQDHRDTASSFNNLAEFYCYQNRFAEAEPLLLQALEVLQRVLGNAHPHTIVTQQSLVYLRQAMNS